MIFVVFPQVWSFLTRMISTRRKMLQKWLQGSPSQMKTGIWQFHVCFRNLLTTPKFRLPWLKTLASLLLDHPDCILACSALKQNYRELLRSSLTSADVAFIYLRCISSMLFLRFVKHISYSIKHRTSYIAMMVVDKCKQAFQGIPGNYRKKAEDETRPLFQGVISNIFLLGSE